MSSVYSSSLAIQAGGRILDSAPGLECGEREGEKHCLKKQGPGKEGALHLTQSVKCPNVLLAGGWGLDTSPSLFLWSPQPFPHMAFSSEPCRPLEPLLIRHWGQSLIGGHMPLFSGHRIGYLAPYKLCCSQKLGSMEILVLEFRHILDYT